MVLDLHFWKRDNTQDTVIEFLESAVESSFTKVISKK